MSTVIKNTDIKVGDILCTNFPSPEWIIYITNITSSGTILYEYLYSTFSTNIGTKDMLDSYSDLSYEDLYLIDIKELLKIYPEAKIPYKNKIVYLTKEELP